MPINERRRDDIATAVAAYDSANPTAPLPRNAARLLAVMFPSEDVCQRSLDAIAAEGFSRKRLPAGLKRLVAAGFLSRSRTGCVRSTPTRIGCTSRRRSTHDDPAVPPAAATARLHRAGPHPRCMASVVRQHHQARPLRPDGQEGRRAPLAPRPRLRPRHPSARPARRRPRPHRPGGAARVGVRLPEPPNRSPGPELRGHCRQGRCLRPHGCQSALAAAEARSGS